MASNVTMAEIARRLGISKTTVSLALANRPGVSEDMRQSIVELADRLNYQRAANSSASSLRRRAMLVVFQRGPIQADLAGLAASYLDGIQAAADDFRLRVVLVTIGTGERIADMSMEVARSEPVSTLGALLMGLKDQSEPVIAQLQSMGIPIAAVNRHWPNSALSFVSVDYTRAQIDAVRYLVDLGHRHIAYIGMDRDEGHSWLEQRRQGYLAALASAHEPLIPYPITAPDAARAVDELLQHHPPVTAVCAANDTIALSIIDELKRRSVAIPHEISVIGFDDDSFNPPSDPPLTTVGYSTFEIGYWATRVLAELAGKNELARMQITMETHLVERASCGAVSAAATMVRNDAT